jgi:hypothetical protein
MIEKIEKVYLEKLRNVDLTDILVQQHLMVSGLNRIADEIDDMRKEQKEFNNDMSERMERIEKKLDKPLINVKVSEPNMTEDKLCGNCIKQNICTNVGNSANCPAYFPKN